ncbi:MAG: TraR/DksA family transcriptional regulator [Flavobacteriales bacterium]|jgi:DnaK suppressor protein|nr:TraR/DksA family transcriptional regulator [Flavobacteriales bacterium]MBT4882322.1 TraR/DksA family transcriptional regulator [Flavobacteriales bacterium]MDG1348168.1 TraR/DksA C4-type zinc finger protein [Flavobacteriales bacterium]
MDETQKKAIEEKLLHEINSTQKKIEEYTELCKPIAPEDSIGRISRMDAINNKSVVEAALREAKNKMQQLLTMQSKIKEIDFGVCIKCKQEIPLGRLMIRPHSKFCVNCAQ